MEAIEHYTSQHGGDSFDDVLEWPWMRFESAYEAMLKRELVADLDKRKSALVGALWANSNWDGEEADRGAAIDNLEKSYEKSVGIVYGYIEADEPDEDDIDWEDPFFAAAKRGLQKTGLMPSDSGDDGTVAELLANQQKELTKEELDQLKEINKERELDRKAMEDFDQY